MTCSMRRRPLAVIAAPSGFGEVQPPWRFEPYYRLSAIELPRVLRLEELDTCKLQTVGVEKHQARTAAMRWQRDTDASECEALLSGPHAMAGRRGTWAVGSGSARSHE
jgi:hypothetical protein